MLDLTNDIRSLSDFKRTTTDLMDQLRKTGHPLVLTINGKAELVVQDAEAYGPRHPGFLLDSRGATRRHYSARQVCCPRF
jgi:hypothetical protein